MTGPSFARCHFLVPLRSKSFLRFPSETLTTSNGPENGNDSFRAERPLLLVDLVAQSPGDARPLKPVNRVLSGHEAQTPFPCSLFSLFSLHSCVLPPACRNKVNAPLDAASLPFPPRKTKPLLLLILLLRIHLPRFLRTRAP